MYKITFTGFSPVTIESDSKQNAIQRAVEYFKEWGITVSKKNMQVIEQEGEE